MWGFRPTYATYLRYIPGGLLSYHGRFDRGFCPGGRGAYVRFPATMPRLVDPNHLIPSMPYI